MYINVNLLNVDRVPHVITFRRYGSRRGVAINESKAGKGRVGKDRTGGKAEVGAGVGTEA